MENWVLAQTGFADGDAAADGNRFLCANGYMGLRGTEEESGSGEFAAVTLAGVYDRYMDRWREPVNAPHGLSVRMAFGGKPLRGRRKRVRWRLFHLYGYCFYRRNVSMGRSAGVQRWTEGQKLVGGNRPIHAG